MIWADTIKWCGDYAELIDQRKLPHEEVYVKINSAKEMYTAIKDMLVRGAPAIGVAAGYGIALSALSSKDRASLERDIFLIESARPTAYNLFYAVKRMRRLLEREGLKPSLFVGEAINIHEEDKKLTELLGEKGSELILQKKAKGGGAHFLPPRITKKGIENEYLRCNQRTKPE